MKSKLLKLSILTGILGSSLTGLSTFPNKKINKELNLEYLSLISPEDVLITKSNNLKEIAFLQKKINILEAENIKINKLISKKPKLYERREVFEETSNDFFYRIKLNDYKVNLTEFNINKNNIYVEIDLLKEVKINNLIHFNERKIKQSFIIPNNVDLNNIKNFVNGDYFTIKMLKKA